MKHLRLVTIKTDHCGIEPLEAYKTLTESHRTEPSISQDRSTRDLSETY